MITETQPCVIVLQLTDKLPAQLQPFMAGLDITSTVHDVEPCHRVMEQQAERSCSIGKRRAVYGAATVLTGCCRPIS
jgi:hypothetical protein